MNSPTMAPITESPAEIFSPAIMLGSAPGRRSFQKLMMRLV